MLASVENHSFASGPFRLSRLAQIARKISKAHLENAPHQSWLLQRLSQAITWQRDVSMTEKGYVSQQRALFVELRQAGRQIKSRYYDKT
jgi:hypothetical protein